MVSKSQMKATSKFNQKTYDTIYVRVRKDSLTNKDAIAMAAEAAGESLNEYIINAVAERIKRETP